MNLKSRCWKLAMLWILLLCPAAINSAETHWEPLIRRLIQDGLDAAFVHRHFSQPAIEYDPQVMVRKLTHMESKLDYGRFLKPDSLARAADYLKAKRQLLARIEARYSVPPEIVVSIFKVETNLGQHLGKSSVFNTFANMAASGEFEVIRPLLPDEFLASRRMDKVRERYARYAKWAYAELKALLLFAQAHGYDPREIRGSIFGAFGLSQFLPTSARRFGVDGNDDGIVDLFQEADALASMANYLHVAGWRGDLSKKAQAKVIFQYNRSRPYVETILAMADRLKEGLSPCQKP